MSPVVALCIVLTILVFLTLDYCVERAKARSRSSPAAALASIVTLVPRPSPPIEGLADGRPAGFFLAPGHVWAELTSAGTFWLGLDRLASGLLGSPDEVAISPPGTRVARGASIAAVRRGARTLSVAAPFDGIVREINPELERDAAVLFADPYGAGKICRIEPDDLEIALPAMRVGARACEWMREEIGRVRDALGAAVPGLRSSALGATLADGGAPIAGAVNELDADAWARIAAAIAAPPPAERSGEQPS